MTIPVPIDTREAIKNVKHSNLGLYFNKFIDIWPNDWDLNEEGIKEFRKKIAGESFSDECLKATINRLRVSCGHLSSRFSVEIFNAITESRLILGLGGANVMGTGITLHPLYGFPYLPASGLKGLARAYAEIVCNADKNEIRLVFGSESKDARAADNIQGKVFFMDGLPMSFPKLELDIMNPHYSEYYQGGKPPADYSSPKLVTFLTVAPGQKFIFAVMSRSSELAAKAKEWLIGGLTELGAGGKTNVGYGYFRVDETEAADVPNNKGDMPPSSSATSLESQLKTVKNPQMFKEFISNIKDNELDELKEISFISLRDKINIGFVSDLESMEISNEIKKTIAKKILEYTTPNNNWDDKKRAKYSRLKEIAGDI